MMETQYLTLLHDVLQNGAARDDRTGVGTLSCFGRQIRCDLKDGFPLLTTKKMGIKSIAGELLWFLSGSGDERGLAEITHGTREGAVTIWTANSLAPYWKPKAKYNGDVGRIYGVQWRGWKKYSIKNYEDLLHHHDGTSSTTYFGAKVSVEHVDQVKNIIETIKRNPYDRRMVLTAFNVGELDEMALPPCHMMAQFYVGKKDELSCQVYIRSNDLFLGLPYNIASYALLTHMIAQVTDKGVGELIITIGDAHVYKNHVARVKEQLTRSVFAPPSLHLNQSVSNIDDFKMGDIEIVGYECHPPIRGEMAV